FLVKPEGAGIVLEVPGGDNLVRPGQAAPAAADQRLGLGGQGDGVEGFGDVVIRPDIQAIEGIVVLFAAADNDDGDLAAVLPDLLDDLEAVHSGQVDIQQKQVIL